ncbi:Mpv17/PMP22 family protein [Thermosipho ferrireducens]|uniref:Mpv17/PMP22 family protein n=1 Tax=Thermosipho ferrireducens TaxID=2571116 RepID=A0ABX7S7Q9_9BACT|nr:Mpv17/PMP22 family protein [Thermosipho ferrireducens]QTA38617.1 Mpv17/PMP22 family protein [Thermosipho ferrireducens]
MKKGDFLVIGFFIALISLFNYKPFHETFLFYSRTHPYFMGFIKVSILATIGELISLRIQKGKYTLPAGLSYKFIIWGFLGITFVAVFEIFSTGTYSLMEKKLLPSSSVVTINNILRSFFTSTLMNLIFAPTFMAFHRITDTFIELGNGKIKNIFSLKLSYVISKINWQEFVNFIILKTIPLFWIPAHTITFLLPVEYRVLMAAILSIVLGILLSFRKKLKTN